MFKINYKQCKNGEIEYTRHKTMYIVQPSRFNPHCCGEREWHQWLQRCPPLFDGPSSSAEVALYSVFGVFVWIVWVCV